MQLFISWSGERSKALASALRDWLPLVIQSVKPWFSPEDIDKGTRWLSDLNTQLENQSVAIICITPESVNAPWLLFEVGALSKALDSSWVCPVLLGIEPTDIQGPLAQFQSTRTTKDDMRRLLSTINKRLESPLAEPHLDTLHELLWPQLNLKLEAIASTVLTPKTPHRATGDLLNEVLATVRSMERQMAELKLSQHPPKLRLNLSKFSDSDEKSDHILEKIYQLSARYATITAEVKHIDTTLTGFLDQPSPEREKLLISRDHLRMQMRALDEELNMLKAMYYGP